MTQPEAFRGNLNHLILPVDNANCGFSAGPLRRADLRKTGGASRSVKKGGAGRLAGSARSSLANSPSLHPPSSRSKLLHSQ